MAKAIKYTLIGCAGIAIAGTVFFVIKEVVKSDFLEAFDYPEE